MTVKSTAAPQCVARRAIVSAAVLLAVLLAHLVAADEAPQQAGSCQPSAPLIRMLDLPEASGLAMSRRTAGRLWTHNDSGAPVLFALDTRGTITARLRLEGVRVDDWEALATGPCPAGDCLYVADIGDNGARRDHITIYRVREPSGTGDSSAAPEAFRAVYPDSAQDAETLLVTPAGDLFIVTKGETGPIAIYRFPRGLQTTTVARLEHSGTSTSTPGARAARITDGAISPDGQWTVLRTVSSLSVYRTAEILAGQRNELRRVDLTVLREPQGEGVAVGADGRIYLAGEGGGKDRPGTLTSFACGMIG